MPFSAQKSQSVFSSRALAAKGVQVWAGGGAGRIKLISILIEKIKNQEMKNLIFSFLYQTELSSASNFNLLRA